MKIHFWLYPGIELLNDVDWIWYLRVEIYDAMFCCFYSRPLCSGACWTHLGGLCRASTFYIFICCRSRHFEHFVVGRIKHRWIELGPSKEGSHCVSFFII